MSGFGKAPDSGEPSGAVRARVLSDISEGVRFDGFADSVARLLDCSVDHAVELLAELDAPNGFPETSMPGVEFRWVQGGPSVDGALTGFVRMPAFANFPDHDHLGDETVLILQGSCIEDHSGCILRAGDEAVRSAGTRHTFTVRPGPDLIYLAVAFDGIQIVGGAALRAGQPRP